MAAVATVTASGQGVMPDMEDICSWVVVAEETEELAAGAEPPSTAGVHTAGAEAGPEHLARSDMAASKGEVVEFRLVSDRKSVV